MTQTEPLTIAVNVSGLLLGYKVLNLDRTQYAAFTTTGMAEVGSSGVYAVAGGVVVPDAGGYIQVYKAPGTEFVGEAAVRSTSANVTHHAGVAVAAADANGNVPVDIRAINSNLAAADGLSALSEWYDAESYVPVLGQEIRDAMKLAPTAGAPAEGSVDAKLDDILTTIGSEIVEGTYTRDDILRIIAAALAGKTSGSGTATVEILGLDGATTRIIASVDGVGNRTAMTLDGAA